MTNLNMTTQTEQKTAGGNKKKAHLPELSFQRVIGADTLIFSLNLTVLSPSPSWQYLCSPILTAPECHIACSLDPLLKQQIPPFCDPPEDTQWLHSTTIWPSIVPCVVGCVHRDLSTVGLRNGVMTVFYSRTCGITVFHPQMDNRSNSGWYQFGCASIHVVWWLNVEALRPWNEGPLC